LEELLREGAPRIVVDRTNPMRYQRRQFAEFANAAGYRVKIVYSATPVEVFRERIRNRKGHPTLAPEKMLAAMAQYDSRLEISGLEECDELVVIRKPRASHAGSSDPVSS
jgi:predicted kinase